MLDLNQLNQTHPDFSLHLEVLCLIPPASSAGHDSGARECDIREDLGITTHAELRLLVEALQKAGHAIVRHNTGNHGRVLVLRSCHTRPASLRVANEYWGQVYGLRCDA